MGFEPLTIQSEGTRSTKWANSAGNNWPKIFLVLKRAHIMMKQNWKSQFFSKVHRWNISKIAKMDSVQPIPIPKRWIWRAHVSLGYHSTLGGSVEWLDPLVAHLACLLGFLLLMWSTELQTFFVIYVKAHHDWLSWSSVLFR